MRDMIDIRDITIVLLEMLDIMTVLLKMFDIKTVLDHALHNSLRFTFF